MRKLTIGIFLEHYDPFFSGVITSVKTLRAELERRGHKVYIIAPSAGKFKDVDPNVIRIPSFATSALENTTVGVPTRALMRRLNAIDFDIIHSQEVFFTCIAGMKLAKKKKIPYVQTYHTLWDRFIDQYELGVRAKLLGLSFLSYPFVFGVRKSLKLLSKPDHSVSEKKFLPRLMWGHMLSMGEGADAIVVPSKHLAGEIEASGIKVPVYAIPNGQQPFKRSSGKLLPRKKAGSLRILSVARHSPEKRVDVLIDAVAKTKTPVQLILIGEGPTDAVLRAQVARLKLEDKVLFMGHLGNSVVREVMNESDILALASYNFDNQPMVILEAVEAGLPIIYCDPKLEEGLSADNALLVGRRPSDFAAGFAKLADVRLRAKMSAASRKISRSYNIGKVADQLLIVYQGLIDHKNDKKA